jgi:photosystem II stability/assembly factor-like uncharacterized protein
LFCTVIKLRRADTIIIVLTPTHFDGWRTRYTRRFFMKYTLLALALALTPIASQAQVVGGEFKLTGLWADATANNFAAVGYSGNDKQSSIVVSEDSGKTWVLRANPSEQLVDIWGSSIKDLYAVGNAGTILHSADAGKTWDAQSSGTSENLLSIWGSSAKDIYAVGKAGIILHSIDAGKSWTSTSYGKKFTLRNVWGFSAKEVYVCGTEGVVIKSLDNGKTWIDAKSGIKDSLRFIAGVKKDLYVLGDRGVVLHSADQGATWDIYLSAAGTEEKPEIFTALFATDAAAYVYPQRDVVLISKDKGKSWDETKAKGSRGISEIVVAAKKLFAVSDGGKIVVSEDGGLLWKELASKETFATK